MVATAGAAARPVARRWRCRRRPRTALGTCAARSRCPPPRPRPWTACLWPCGLSAGSRLVASGEDANRSSCVSVGRWSLERTQDGWGKANAHGLCEVASSRSLFIPIGQTCEVSCDSHTQKIPHRQPANGKRENHSSPVSTATRATQPCVRSCTLCRRRPSGRARTDAAPATAGVQEKVHGARARAPAAPAPTGTPAAGL